MTFSFFLSNFLFLLLSARGTPPGSWLDVSAIRQSRPMLVERSSVSFSIKHGVGTTAAGTLAPLAVEGQWDVKNIGASWLRGTLPVNSIKTGVGARDRHLLKAEYFDAARYPQLSMDVRNIVSQGANTYKAVALLQMKATKKPVPISFTASPLADGKWQLKTQFRISRLDYGVGESSWLLADSLTVMVETVVKP